MLDLFEFNLPTVDRCAEENSHYGLLALEIMMQTMQLTKSNNRRFREAPVEVVAGMIHLAFNDYFDGFTINCIYTKGQVKPDDIVIDAIVPDILKILHGCALFVHHKKQPEMVTNLPGRSLRRTFSSAVGSTVEPVIAQRRGCQLIEFGTTFQLSTHSDCYLKHMISLNRCDQIDNHELIDDEIGDVYLPTTILAKDLVMYEQQLGMAPDPPGGIGEDRGAMGGHPPGAMGGHPPGAMGGHPPDVSKLIKLKEKEITGRDVPYRKAQCLKAIEYRRMNKHQTDHAVVVVECYDDERDVLLAWHRLITANDPDVIVGYNIFDFDFKFLFQRATELQCVEQFCQLGRLVDYVEPLHEQPLSSAGMGDNFFRYLPMIGRILIDLYKVIQRSHNLDSYKLDSVCHKFLYKEKVNIAPARFLSCRKAVPPIGQIAKYCLIHCILCNRLLSKMEIIGNNMSCPMSATCD